MDTEIVKEQEPPLVSVCLFAYQHAAYIAECIESALMQSCTFPFEILIGEDGSTDGTREICRQYAEKYPGKIRLFERSRKDVIYVNGNPTGRFNFIETMKAAKGKYLALCDGDDYWTDKLKLQKQADLLEANPDSVACHHWQKIASPDKEGKYEVKDAPTEGQGYWPEPISGVREIFTNQLRLKSRTILFRNVFLNDYQLPEWFYKVAFGDVSLCMILGKQGDFIFIDEEMAVYRLTGSGVSTKGNKDPLFTLKHYLEWIRIWEHGDKFHNKKYHKEALGTIFYFYKSIFDAYGYSRPVFRKAMNYALYNSGYNFFIRISVARKLQKIYHENRRAVEKS